MSSPSPQPQRTLVIMLGGSIYPHNPGFDNPRFKASAEGLRAYFEDPLRFGLPEGNLLWLFDSTANPGDLNEKIDVFLSAASQRPEHERPLDVVVYFVGHGFFDDEKHYYLATPGYRPNAPEYSYSFRWLQRTIKQQMRFSRKFFVIDACYSGSAARESMSAEPLAVRIKEEVDAGAIDDLPERGTAVLSASSKDDEAIAPEEDTCTMFSGSLLSVLQDPGTSAEALNLYQLHALVENLVVRRFKNKAVRPELHIPEQKKGDVGKVPLFALRRAGVVDASGVHDALDPATFADESLLRAVVICSQRRSGEPLPLLLQAVSDAWEDKKARIVAAANLCRTEWRAPLVPADRDNRGFVLAHLAIERACDSMSSMQAAIAALCRAEIAVFDLTDWDPVAVFLLGVRSVARRGVTITSIGGDYTIGSALAVPFNLQLLNMVAHSKAQEAKEGDSKPYKLIGDKIENGFRDLANLPHYLDLPAYDSVRQLGVESGAYRPVQASERVLVLCPFGVDYTAQNLARLEKRLPGRVVDYMERSLERQGVKTTLVRLLDLKTPRLVAQTLFESIRLTDMCVVDWTGMRANVIFEAGVRLAINPLGAVHIVEDSTRERSRQDPTEKALLALFEPIPYALSGTDAGPFDRMVQRFDASLKANRRGETNFVYAAVGTRLDRRSQPAAVPLVSELTRSANLLDPEDQETVGISPVLYHVVNRDLVTEAREAAADRRLAAWLFLSRRYQPREILEQPPLMASFDLLSRQVRRWARRTSRLDLVDEVNARLKDINVSRRSAGTGAAADDQEASLLLARAKSGKEEAKDLKESGDIKAAVESLNETVDFLSTSALAVGLEHVTEAAKPLRELASQLADCLGMLGGNYKRLKLFEEARHCFERGRAYEESPTLGVMSSYNLVNEITLAIEVGHVALASRHSQIQSAIEVLSRQVRGERRNDRWAWADLAQCQLLLGDQAAALQSYARARDLGDESSAQSVIGSLNQLGAAVPALGPQIAAAVATLSK
jgi:tetratricopeptide (TPR) repeat protein